VLVSVLGRLESRGSDHCHPINSLSLRDAYMDRGGRATQEAKAERVGESEARGRGPISKTLNLYPLFLAFSRREKGWFISL
jgi:hypothetical protein